MLIEKKKKETIVYNSRNITFSGNVHISFKILQYSLRFYNRVESRKSQEIDQIILDYLHSTVIDQLLMVHDLQLYCKTGLKAK